MTEKDDEREARAELDRIEEYAEQHGHPAFQDEGSAFLQGARWAAGRKHPEPEKVTDENIRLATLHAWEGRTCAEHPCTCIADDALLRELEGCAMLADGTLRGELVPLADFTRHRIAKALREAAAALTEREPIIVDGKGDYFEGLEEGIKIGRREPVVVDDAMVERGFLAALRSGAGQIMRADIRAALTAALTPDGQEN